MANRRGMPLAMMWLLFDDQRRYYPDPVKEKDEEEHVFVDDDALYVALDRRDWDAARELLARRDSDATDGDDRLRLVRSEYYFDDALHQACRNNAPLDVVRIVHDVHPLAAHKKGAHGFTPLHRASSSSSEEVVAWLAATAPRSAAVRDLNGWTPLHHAVECRREPSLVRVLLRTWPAAVRAVDEDGDDPLRLFLDVWREDVEETLSAGSRGRGRSFGVDAPRHFRRTFSLLLRAYARGRVTEKEDDEDVDEDDWSLLHEAIRRDEIVPAIHVRALLRATVPRQDKEGNLPLHLVCSLT